MEIPGSANVYKIVQLHDHYLLQLRARKKTVAPTRAPGQRYLPLSNPRHTEFERTHWTGEFQNVTCVFYGLWHQFIRKWFHTAGEPPDSVVPNTNLSCPSILNKCHAASSSEGALRWKIYQDNGIPAMAHSLAVLPYYLHSCVSTCRIERYGFITTTDRTKVGFFYFLYIVR